MEKYKGCPKNIHPTDFVSWKFTYIKTLKFQGKMTFKEALENFNAGIDTHDFDNDPEQQALDEISYGND